MGNRSVSNDDDTVADSYDCFLVLLPKEYLVEDQCKQDAHCAANARAGVIESSAWWRNEIVASARARWGSQLSALPSCAQSRAVARSQTGFVRTAGDTVGHAGCRRANSGRGPGHGCGPII